MSEAPERIWAVDSATRFWFEERNDLHDCIEYIRADLYEATIDILEQTRRERDRLMDAIQMMEAAARRYKVSLSDYLTSQEADQ